MIFAGRSQGAALLFIRESVFVEPYMHDFSHLFAKIYTFIRFGGLEEGSAPLPKKILYLVT